MREIRKLPNNAKRNKSKRGKDGFTLVELSVVLAITVMVVVAIAAFSTYINQYMRSDRTEYKFLEKCDEIEDELYHWIAEQDGQGEDLAFLDGMERYTFGDTLELPSGVVIQNAETVKKISFKVEGDLIKCNITRLNDEESVRSLVFALRYGDMAAELTEQPIEQSTEQGGGAGE